MNDLLKLADSGISIAKFSSKDVIADIPSALRGQVARDARAKHRKYVRDCKRTERDYKRKHKKNKRVKLKLPKLPQIKSLYCIVNNQNFRVEAGCIKLPFMVGGKSKRLSLRTFMTERQKLIFQTHRLCSLTICVVNGKILAKVTYEVKEVKKKTSGYVMGVDLGIKCPAVSYVSDGHVKFYGNGRANQAMRRHYKAKRKQLMRAKHIDAVRRLNNKEQRIMRDVDHKLSHDIVREALTHNIRVVRLEQLSSVRNKLKSKKHNYAIGSWSFYRLSKFIEYKAALVGIAVEYVNPAYTSKYCPVCGRINNANDRLYVCECGYHSHRDIVGAINICNSTEHVDYRHAA